MGWFKDILGAASTYFTGTDFGLGGGDGGEVDGGLLGNFAAGALQGYMTQENLEKFGPLAQIGAQNEGAMERLIYQLDFQKQAEFDRAARITVAGDVAHGGAEYSSDMPDLFSGLQGQDIEGLFSSIETSGSRGNQAGGLIDPSKYREAGRGDPNAPMDYAVSDQYKAALGPLRRYLGITPEDREAVASPHAKPGEGYA
jgi:hypothetical protein